MESDIIGSCRPATRPYKGDNDMLVLGESATLFRLVPCLKIKTGVGLTGPMISFDTMISLDNLAVVIAFRNVKISPR